MGRVRAEQAGRSRALSLIEAWERACALSAPALEDDAPYAEGLLTAGTALARELYVRVFGEEL